MRYDGVELDVQWFPSILSLALIQYIPRSRAPASKLVLDFKENQPRALRKVRDLALQALGDYEDVAMFRRGYLVTIPPHAKDGVNWPCEYLCAELAAAFPRQLVHFKQALRRVADVRKSATAPSGARPSYDDHFKSIRYAGPARINTRERIMMVDDVLTRGETSRACRDILRQATGCKDVLGFFVAKTLFR